ncbi:MAG: signal peptidase II [Deltaproteobacteria bacterium]|nr:signal peptidase II [Deltaproteobacteria bacterium]
MKKWSLWFVLFVVPLYALDQLTKWIVCENLPKGRGIVVVPGFLEIIHVRNTGAAFGILQGIPVSWRTIFFLIVTIAACLAIVFILTRQGAEDVFLEAMFYLVIAGALGNLTDRLRFKEVVDFLNFHIGALSWPTFNMADTYISIAIVGIFIRTFVKGKKARSR